MVEMQPTVAEIAAAITLAARAPSVHNTQPWRWRVTSSALELYADGTRRLEVADPRSRLLTISCGATLYHLVIAMRVAGWESSISRLPDPHAPEKMASISFVQRTADVEDRALAVAILERRTDRRPLSIRVVPEELATRFDAAAGKFGARARRLDATEAAAWTALARTAARAQQRLADRQAHQIWADRDDVARGILTPLRPSHGESARGGARRAGGGVARATGSRLQLPRWLPMLITTPTDDSLDRLRAGEAMSAVLLEATRNGLATSIESQVLEVTATRSYVEERILQSAATPHVLLTIGWPSAADPLPPTSRRAVQDIATFAAE